MLSCYLRVRSFNLLLFPDVASWVGVIAVEYPRPDTLGMAVLSNVTAHFPEVGGMRGRYACVDISINGVGLSFFCGVGFWLNVLQAGVSCKVGPDWTAVCRE